MPPFLKAPLPWYLLLRLGLTSCLQDMNWFVWLLQCCFLLAAEDENAKEGVPTFIIFSAGAERRHEKQYWYLQSYSNLHLSSNPSFHPWKCAKIYWEAVILEIYTFNTVEAKRGWWRRVAFFQWQYQPEHHVWEVLYKLNATQRLKSSVISSVNSHPHLQITLV